MVNTVEIIEGHYQGSNQITVAGNLVDETAIVIYRSVGNVHTLAGTGEIGNDISLGPGYGYVYLTENISEGDILVAYVEERGKQGGNPVLVYIDTENIKTGWRNPSSVVVSDVDLTYAAYLTAGGAEIADIYSPDSTINNTVDRQGYVENKYIDFSVELKYTTATISNILTNVCIVTVSNFSAAIGNPRIIWDINNPGRPEATQVYQKQFLFAENGTHTVTVLPENDLFGDKTFEFTIAVAGTTPSPSTTEIWSYGYGINPEQNRTVYLTAFSNQSLESRLLITGSETFSPMFSNSGSRWIGSFTDNVPTGNYTGEIRVIGTSAVVTVTVKVTF